MFARITRTVAVAALTVGAICAGSAAQAAPAGHHHHGHQGGPSIVWPDCSPQL